jgi:hypothetical protein
MLRTAELDMADSVTPNDVNVFLDNVEWAIGSTYHTVLNVRPTRKYVPKLWDKLPNKQQFLPKLRYT